MQEFDAPLLPLTSNQPRMEQASEAAGLGSFLRLCAARFLSALWPVRM
jgi:hypothetical protein